MYPSEWIVDGLDAAKERILSLASASDEAWASLERQVGVVIASRYEMR